MRQTDARGAMLETALDCIITMDHEGRVVAFNPAAEITFGYRRGEVEGRELADLIIPEDLRQRHRRGLARYLAGGEPTILGTRVELRALHADGTEFPVELAISRIPSDGSPLFIAYLRDISERVQSERHRSLRLTVTQLLGPAANVAEIAPGLLRAVCEGLGWDGGFFWIHDSGTDALHLLKGWSRPGVTITRLEAVSQRHAFGRGEGLPGHAWATGEPTWLLDAVEAANFPRAASAAEEGLHAAFACPLVGAGTTLGVIEFFSQRIRKPDAALLETMATVAGLIGHFMERKQAEDALRQSEARYRALVEQAPFSIQVFEPDGQTIEVNRAWEALWGVEAERIKGYNVLEDGQLEARGILHYVQRGFAGQATRIPAIQYNPNETMPGVARHDDPRRWLSAVIYPLKDPAGRVRQVVLIHEDITAQTLAEDALRESRDRLRDANQRKDEFLATLAHELRNPLAPIHNSLQILKMPRVDAETSHKTRAVMERQVHHLVRLVDDLLDVSRVMRGKITLHREPVELASVVARAVETAQPLIEVQDHDLEISLPPDSLLLDADPVRLSQVVANLLTNAAKYTESGGHISLSVCREADEAVLRVRDSGIGIAADMLPHVFDLFVQVDQGTTRSHGGLGLGLTLVKNLVEMHGGAVHAHSTGLGEGSEFVVRLPLLARQREASEAATERDRSTEVTPSGHRLLVVDDNHDAATTLATLLRMQGHDVRVANDGASALDAAKAFRPAMMFLDIGMPGMDGFEVARRIRATPGLEDTVLAALTGWGQQEDRRRSAQAGFDHHLVKPLNPLALDTLLAELGRPAPGRGLPASDEDRHG